MKSFKHISRFLPFVLFFLICIILWCGLSLHPNQIPSPLVNKPIPHFELPNLWDAKQILSEKSFNNKVILLNVWATWCIACVEEHSLLLKLAKENGIIFYGLNYKDNIDAAKQLLQQRGNPYKKVFVDTSGDTAIDLGVYGTPETFLIDKKGIIRYKHIGPISNEAWLQTLKPLIDKLNKEPL